MDYVDLKYINILSVRFQKFKQKSPTLFVFRCPICGDSKKFKNKTRGYLFEKNNHFFFKCHNCNASHSLEGLIKELDHNLYEEYRIEKFYIKKEVVVSEEKKIIPY